MRPVIPARMRYPRAKILGAAAACRWANEHPNDPPLQVSAGGYLRHVFTGDEPDAPAERVTSVAGAHAGPTCDHCERPAVETVVGGATERVLGRRCELHRRAAEAARERKQRAEERAWRNGGFAAYRAELARYLVKRLGRDDALRKGARLGYDDD